MTYKDVKISDFLAEGNILCDMGSCAFPEAIDRLVSLLSAHVGGFDCRQAIETVLQREKQSSTVLAADLALPHARLEDVQRSLVAVGLSSEGIRFPESEDPVHIVFVVLSPKSDPSGYLRLVSAISKSLSDPELRQRLSQCSTAPEAYKILTTGTIKLPDHLVARDLMDPDPKTLREEDDLSVAIHAFCVYRLWDIPVVDDARDIRGIVSIEDLLQLSLPEHFLWMEDLTPIVNFQPFAELLRKDHETKVADFMRETFTSIRPDTPAIQLAKDFIKTRSRQIIVANGTHLEGGVNIQQFVAQLFWA